MSEWEGHGDGCVCYSCISHGEDIVTIPRDLYELLKEAAEKWARAREDHDVGFEAVNWGDPLRRFLILSCRECDVATRGKVNDESELSIVHAAGCRAARILGLKREGV